MSLCREKHQAKNIFVVMIFAKSFASLEAYSSLGIDSNRAEKGTKSILAYWASLLLSLNMTTPGEINLVLHK